MCNIIWNKFIQTVFLLSTITFEPHCNVSCAVHWTVTVFGWGRGECDHVFKNRFDLSLVALLHNQSSSLFYFLFFLASWLICDKFCKVILFFPSVDCRLFLMNDLLVMQTCLSCTPSRRTEYQDFHHRAL